MANQIAILRAALRLSRLEFAEELGVVRTTVMRWEKGQITPPSYIDDALIALAKRRGVAWPPKKKLSKAESIDVGLAPGLEVIAEDSTRRVRA
jgi:transcriptional regulator with XRE-family HTH domain